MEDSRFSSAVEPDMEILEMDAAVSSTLTMKLDTEAVVDERFSL